MLPKTEIGYAKINLALQVRSKRDDGYHELETLFAFLDTGDDIFVQDADAYALEFGGEFGGLIGKEGAENNLITLAVSALCDNDLPKIKTTLQKTLPIAAGLGGGSADAAAMIRAMAGILDYDINSPKIHEIASALGADIPACINSVPIIGRGTGTDLTPVLNDVAGLSCVLVNPRLPLATGPVFQKWNGNDLGPLSSGTAIEIMKSGRNDLEVPAIHLCPQIADILSFLNDSNPLIARMSGSGATCFALFENHNNAIQLAKDLKISRPQWWHMIGRLR
jgi:4-diphosphocytidyl-2-C-methyl-D-erythritol kinase